MLSTPKEGTHRAPVDVRGSPHVGADDGAGEDEDFSTLTQRNSASQMGACDLWLSIVELLLGKPAPPLIIK